MAGEEDRRAPADDCTEVRRSDCRTVVSTADEVAELSNGEGEGQIIVHYTGKLVGVNDWKMPCRAGGKVWMSLTPEYRAFMEEIACAMRMSGKGMISGMFDVELRMNVGPLADHHNFCKPILDAIEKSGLIENDRLAGDVFMPVPLRHKRGLPDEVTIILTPRSLPFSPLAPPCEPLKLTASARASAPR